MDIVGPNVPDEDDLEMYYQALTELDGPSQGLEFAEPLDVAKQYYIEDNRPVLFDPEEERP
jgi:hypothetical protein